MNDRIDPGERSTQLLGVANVTTHQLDIRTQISRTCATWSVNLWNEKIEDPHAMTVREKFVCDM
jgi:hypothetical protein